MTFLSFTVSKLNIVTSGPPSGLVHNTPPPSLQVADPEARGLPVISVQLLFHSREKSKECGQGNVNIFRRGNELALDTEVKHRV